MRADNDRWERRYAAAEDTGPDMPDAVLVEHRGQLRGGGRALDVASGDGRNAFYLARAGYRVLAADISLTALRRVRDVARREHLDVAPLLADLDVFFPAPACFDLVVVVRFLDRALIPRLKRSLKPGGLLFYRTLNQNMLARRPGFNPDYLLHWGELASLFADFRTIACHEPQGTGELLSHWIGRKPES